MDAKRSNKQIHRGNAQPGVACFCREIRRLVPKCRWSIEERHRLEPAEEWRALPSGSTGEKFKAHLFAKQCILGMNGGRGDLPRGFRRAFAQVVDPDAGVDYLSEWLFRSSSCMAS